MNIALLIILIFFVLLSGYLAIIIFFPVLPFKDQMTKRKAVIGDIPNCRQDISISIKDTFLSAWLYLPENATSKVPCVILSIGFGGTKDALLEKYALKFVENGLAAIAYDYRHFGESGGEPRQLFNMFKLQDDLRAVIDYARKHEKIDDEKIILWSVSAAGGYGINVAATDHKIAGIISQCPNLDNVKEEKTNFEREGIKYYFRILAHSLRDQFRSWFGLSTHYTPIVGKPHTTAFMLAPGALEGYQNIMANSKYFFNGVCGRSLFQIPGPNVIKTAVNVKCPVLIIVCENDTCVSRDSHKKVADVLNDKATVVKFPVGHFDLYSGDYFEKAIAAQLRFIKKIV